MLQVHGNFTLRIEQIHTPIENIKMPTLNNHKLVRYRMRKSRSYGAWRDIFSVPLNSEWYNYGHD